MPITETPSNQRHAVRFVLMTVFVYAVGFGIITPVLPELIVELEGISLSDAAFIGGMIAISYAICQFLMGPLVGNLGDRFGRRPVFLLSLAGFSIDFCLMGFAPNILWLFIGRSMSGALGAIFGPSNAVMTDLFPPEERAKRFGMVGAAFGIGFVIGPAIGGFLGEFGARTPFFVAAGMAGALFIYGFFKFKETLPEERRRAFSWKRANPLGAFLALRQLQGVIGIASIYLIWVTSTNIYPVVWAYFAPIQFGWDSKMVGISLTCAGISMFLAQSFLIGRIVTILGERKTAITAISFASLVMLFYTVNTSGTLALGICFLVGVQSMAMPCINAMMSRRTPSTQQGELQGFNGSLAALAALFAPLLYNTSLSYYTNPNASVTFAGAPFVISAALGIIAVIALIRLKPSTDAYEEDITNAITS